MDQSYLGLVVDWTKEIAQMHLVIDQKPEQREGRVETYWLKYKIFVNILKIVSLGLNRRSIAY